MKAPLISVIMPVYNCERYLGHAVESVLAQTYAPVEIIVVDSSTDSSGEVARSFRGRVRYFFQEKTGIGAARNFGADLARGDFLSFLDADDLWVEEKLALQMETFEDNPELDIVFGHVRQFHSQEIDESIKTSTRIPSEVMPGYTTGTMLIRGSAFFGLGLFDTSLRVGEFVDWYLKAVEKGAKSLMLPRVLLNRRVHYANTGIRERGSRPQYLRILKASLDRRRKVKPS